jgi:hypothetical protein
MFFLSLKARIHQIINRKFLTLGRFDDPFPISTQKPVMKKNQKVLLATLMFTAAILTGCASSKPSGVPATNEDVARLGDSSTPQAWDISQNQNITKRIVIYDATLKMVVKSPDSTNVNLSKIASKHEGYVQVLGNKKSIIRVKSERLEGAIAEISTLGKVKDKTISGNDVTEQYTDYQIRLDNASNARKRYLELLAKAETVEAALKVEKELERLNGEIDSLEGKINQLKHLSEYSTITVYLEEKVKPGILGYVGIGLYESVKWIFVRN